MHQGASQSFCFVYIIHTISFQTSSHQIKIFKALLTDSCTVAILGVFHIWEQTTQYAICIELICCPFLIVYIFTFPHIFVIISSPFPTKRKSLKVTHYSSYMFNHKIWEVRELNSTKKSNDFTSHVTHSMG